MRIKKNFRAGFGLGQIMATLLVVLPTLAFSVTFLIEYWKVMQVDNRLKLIASMASDFADQRSELRAFSDTDSTDFITAASKLCPKGRTIPITALRAATDAPKGIIDITVKYTTPADATYFKSKVISTNMKTYAFDKDSNMSVVLTCPTN